MNNDNLEIKWLKIERDQLNERIEKLEAALQFYGNSDNWSYSVGEAIFHPADEYGSGPRWAHEALGDSDE